MRNACGLLWQVDLNLRKSGRQFALIGSVRLRMPPLKRLASSHLEGCECGHTLLAESRFKRFLSGACHRALAGMIPGSVFNRAIMSEPRVIQEYRALETCILDAMTLALTDVE